ncbi:MAG TPA: four helix bundle protein [Acidobacteriota bacterium]|nr:four helix bundle protein [Acidobacteriota bacterium]HQG93314.1 four helix bundle protein [Acidobacteriota bacterium]
MKKYLNSPGPHPLVIDMSTVKRFEDLRVWQKARELAQTIYSITRRQPFAGDFGLRDQIRRAAVSVVSNIAEGYESQTRAMFISFLHRARGSAGELRAQCHIACDVGYLKPEEFDTLAKHVITCSRQISRLIQYLETDPGPPSSSPHRSRK